MSWSPLHVRSLSIPLLAWCWALAVTGCNPNPPNNFSINVVLTDQSISVGRSTTAKAQRVYANGRVEDVDSSTQTLWASSDAQVATVARQADGTAEVTALNPGSSIISVLVDGKAGAANLTVTVPPLRSIAVSPASASVLVGRTQPFTATGSYSDGTTRDVTSSVTWSSISPSIATVNSTGLANGVAIGGPITVTATLSGVSGTAQLTVTPPELTSLQLTPSTTSIPVGRTQPFTARGSYSDGTTRDVTSSAAWSSSNASIATVSSSGLATGVAIGGPITVTASLGSVSATAQLTVTPPEPTSLQLTPSTASVVAGRMQQFIARGSYSDGTTRDVTSSAAWSSSNASIATVNSTGLATGVAAGGPITVTATLGGVSGTAQLTVTAPPVITSLQLTPSTASVLVGGTQQFTARGSYSDGTTRDVTSSAAWSSSNASIATVSSSGLATGVAIGGPITVTASLGSVSATAQLNVAGWSSAGSMTTVRSQHTATRLLSGKVLITGGWDNRGRCLAAAELYDPATNSWSAARPMATARCSHTATMLSNGRVLVAGGSDGASYHFSAELYDPATNTWSSAGNMAHGRTYHAATLLSSGKVLVMGGYANQFIGTAELYDSATNTWSPAGSMSFGRHNHTATLLPSSKVLVAGGIGGGATTELYDPATNTWSPTGSMSSSRGYHTATLLSSGKVLIAGTGGFSDSSFLSTAEVYDPATNAWSPTGSMSSSRGSHTATLLSSGKVLVAGGTSRYNNNYLATAELYDPATNAWSSAGSMSLSRSGHTATLLSSGKLLVAGGFDNSTSHASAELFIP